MHVLPFLLLWFCSQLWREISFSLYQTTNSFLLTASVSVIKFCILNSSWKNSRLAFVGATAARITRRSTAPESCPLRTKGSWLPLSCSVTSVPCKTRDIWGGTVPSRALVFPVGPILIVCGNSNHDDFLAGVSRWEERSWWAKEKKRDAGWWRVLRGKGRCSRRLWAGRDRWNSYPLSFVCAKACLPPARESLQTDNFTSRACCNYTSERWWHQQPANASC